VATGWLASRSAFAKATVSRAFTCGAKPGNTIADTPRSANIANAIRDFIIWGCFGCRPPRFVWGRCYNNQNEILFISYNLYLKCDLRADAALGPDRRSMRRGRRTGWLPLPRCLGARQAYPIMNVRRRFAQSRGFEQRFPLNAGRGNLCATASLGCQLGKAIAQRDGSLGGVLHRALRIGRERKDSLSHR
jgi:hypothetical protein